MKALLLRTLLLRTPLLLAIVASYLLATTTVLGQDRETNTAPPNPNSRILFRSVAPGTCINPGERFVVNGNNLLAFGTPRLLLRSTTQPTAASGEIQIAARQADATQLQAVLPRDAGIQSNQRYQVGIRNSRGSIWTDSPPLYLSVCADDSKTVQTSTYTPQPTKPETRPPAATTPAPARQETNPAPVAPSRSAEIDVVTETTPRAVVTGPAPEAGTAPEAKPEQNARVETAPEPETDAPASQPAPIENIGGDLSARDIPPPPQLPQLTADAIPEDSIEPEQIVIVAPTMEASLELANEVQQLGLRIKTRQNLNNLDMVINVFRLPEGSSEAEMVNQLRQQLGDDVWIDTNQRFQLMSDNKKRYGQDMVASPSCQTALRLGMVDTPVFEQHHALRDASITQHNVIDRGETPATPEHGTAIAGLLVGNSKSVDFAGLLPNAELFIANAFRSRGKERETTVEWVVLALDWLAGQQVSVINLSLGGRRNLIIELTVQRLLTKGIALIAAAGNGGSKGEPVYPAAQQGVIAVTAVDVRQRLYRKATRGDYISFAAPGVDIWTADIKGKGLYQSGTSFAAPFVTALTAVLRTKSRDSWQDSLQQSVIDLGPQGRDSEFGWGLVQWSPGC